MSKQYKIGYYYERKVKQILEKDGYLVWRSPASKSPIEIINKLKEILKRINIELSNNYESKATNIVINGKFDYTDINIEKIYNDFDDARYDPERFPAVSVPYYLSKDYKVTFNIFKDGHFVCAGIKGDISVINQHINEIVNSFQENIIKKYAKMWV